MTGTEVQAEEKKEFKVKSVKKTDEAEVQETPTDEQDVYAQLNRIAEHLGFLEKKLDQILEKVQETQKTQPPAFSQGGFQKPGGQFRFNRERRPFHGGHGRPAGHGGFGRPEGRGGFGHGRPEGRGGFGRPEGRGGFGGHGPSRDGYRSHGPSHGNFHKKFSHPRSHAGE